MPLLDCLQVCGQSDRRKVKVIDTGYDFQHEILGGGRRPFIFTFFENSSRSIDNVFVFGQ